MTIIGTSGNSICLKRPHLNRCALRSSGALAAAAGLAVGEVEGQQVLGEGAVGGRLVFGRVVGADAAWDRLDDDIVVRPEEERAGVARAVVAIDDAVRR